MAGQASAQHTETGPTTMTTVAVLGLGAMGSRMAGRLLDHGHDVIVWNRRHAKTRTLLDRGARAAFSPADAAAGAEVVITMLSDPAALRAVTEGAGGVLAGIRRGSTLIEMSTVGPAAIERLASLLPPVADLIDAPVLGSLEQAESGGLKIFVGGTDDVVARWSVLLRVLGTPLHIGPPGAGATAKLIANGTLFGVLGVLGEALALGGRLGLTDDALYRVLAETPLAQQAQRRRHAIQSDDYPTRFALSLALKDVDLLVESAVETGFDPRLGRAAASWLADADDAGRGGLDYTAVLGHILAESSSPSPRRTPARGVSPATAPHYAWGDGCDGWRLADGQGMSVIEERMPPGTAEQWHVHGGARQFFFVLDGEATLCTSDADLRVRAGSGVEVGPGVAHQLTNRSAAPLRLLVLSCPTSRGDRRSVAQPDGSHLSTDLGSNAAPP